MPGISKLRDLHQGLVKRVLGGDGETSPDQRFSVFNNTDVPQPLQALVQKVAYRSAQVTDGDLEAVQAAGHSDNQIFELIVCAAVGAATRQYESGLAALDGVADRRRSG